MIIFPAIDLYDGVAVRLVHGEYSRMTVCSDAPVEKAMEFRLAGAEYLHLVDLQAPATASARISRWRRRSPVSPA